MKALQNIENTYIKKGRPHSHLFCNKNTSTHTNNADITHHCTNTNKADHTNNTTNNNAQPQASPGTASFFGRLPLGCEFEQVEKCG